MQNVMVYSLDRSRDLVDLSIPEKAGVTKYRLRAHYNLNDAYGSTNGVGGSGTVALFDVTAGTFFRSRSVALRGLRAEESFRERTRIQFDPADYHTPGSGLPLNEDMIFLRVQEYSTATGAFLPEGPIKILPPPGFFKEQFPALTLAGKAPGVTAVAGGVPPAGSMHLVFPRYVKDVFIFNLNPSNSLLVSYGRRMPMMEIAGLTSIAPDGEFNEMYLASPLTGAAVEFSIQAQIVNAGG